VAFMKRLEDYITHRVASIASESAKRPVVTIVVFFVICAGFSLGLLRINVVFDGESLWVDQHSVAMGDKKLVDGWYPEDPYYTGLVIVARPPLANICTMNAIRDVFALHDRIMAIKTQNANASFLVSGMGGPLGFWMFNSTIFNDSTKTDADVAAQCAMEFYPETFYQVLPNQVFANFSLNSTGTGASAIGFREYYEQATESVVNGVDYEGDQTEWSKQVIDMCAGYKTDYIEVFVEDSSSFDDELERTITSDIPLFFFAYGTMFIFASLTLGSAFNILNNRAIVAIADVFGVILGTAAGYGVAALCGVSFTSIIQILPFVLVGIGLDDAYVMAFAFDQTDAKLPVDTRIYQSTSKAGMSITVTSFTDIGAFLFGSITKIPAITWFCQYAALAILFIYIAHITYFPALLALDAQRVKSRRADCLPCCKLSTENQSGESENLVKPPQKPNLSEWCFGNYADVLLKPAVKVFVLLFFMTLFAIGVWQVTLVKTNFELRDLTPDNSYLRDKLDAENKYFGSGDLGRIPTALYFQEINYRDGDVQKEMQRLVSWLGNQSTIDTNEPMLNWHLVFSQWASEAYANNTSMDGKYVVGDVFYTALKRWLTMDESLQFHEQLVLTPDNSTIKASRIVAFHEPGIDAQHNVEMLKDAHSLPDTFLEPKPFVSSDVYIFFDQYRIIIPETMVSVGLSFISVLLVCTIFLVYPRHVAVIVVVLVMIFVVLFGSLPVWGIDLNALSAVNLIVAIGFVVDYSVHIIHSFGLQGTTLTKDQRVKGALTTMGPSVFMGISTTFLGILPLAFATSEGFRIFFKMLFSIIIIGGSHALIFLPVLLSLVGNSQTFAPTITADPTIIHAREDDCDASAILEGPKNKLPEGNSFMGEADEPIDGLQLTLQAAERGNATSFKTGGQGSPCPRVAHASSSYCEPGE